MPAPLTLNFGPWLPDVANSGVAVDAQQGAATIPLADCLNVYYADGQYRSFPTATNEAANDYVLSAPLGAFTGLDPGGNATPVVGTAGAIDMLNPNGSNFVQVGSGYTARSWSFCQFGAQMYATDNSLLCTDGLQSWGFGTDAAAATVSGAPCSAVVATVGQFVMVGNLAAPITGFAVGTGTGASNFFTATSTNYPIRPGTVRIYVAGVLVGSDATTYGVISPVGGSTLSATSSVSYEDGLIQLHFTAFVANGAAITANFVQAFISRVQWSAIGNGQSWPVPLTNAAIAAQSGYQDNDADLGAVTVIAGYPLYCLIFQKSGIQRAQYVGGQVVFSFGAYERKRGCIATNTAVQVSGAVYFLAEDGFFETDGASVTPIGTASDNSAGIDNWFWANVNPAALGAISGAYDATLRCVMWAIPTGSATAPNLLLIYNPLAGKWTKATQLCTLIWSDSDGTRHKVGLFSQLTAATYYYYQSLAGIPATGYLETCDTIPDDGTIRYTVGAIPNIDCTDVPLTQIGVRSSLSRSVSYTGYRAQDQFTTVAPFLAPGARYTRARVASAAANAINGVTLLQEAGGPM